MNVSVQAGDNAVIADNSDWKKQFLDSTTPGRVVVAENKSKPVETPLTLTDKIGRDFFMQYIQLKQAGLDGDTTAVGNVANNISGSLGDSLKPAVYSISDVKIITDSNAAAKGYAQSLSLILKNIPTTDAAEIANSAFDKGDMTLLKGIDPIITSYQSMRTALLALPAPRSVAQYHLDLINSVSKVLFNIQALRKLEIDPAQGLAALSVYVTAFQGVSNALNNIQSYFNLNGIQAGS